MLIFYYSLNETQEAERKNKLDVFAFFAPFRGELEDYARLRYGYFRVRNFTSYVAM